MPRLTGMPLLAAIAAALFGIAAGAYLWQRNAAPPAGRANPAAPAASTALAPSTYVGEPACTPCHEGQTKEWRQSHHARAMEVAGESTVLGDFDNASFTYAGITSTFTKRDGRFFVRTDGPDGQLHDYEIAYTFGFVPLQQYLVPFPGGRYQCLPIAWDTRPREQGGQRWFHLYPADRITSTDPLHWTGPNQNWNYMCADCHSTNLVRNFDLGTNTYTTTWSEINVSCETCHGPGSAHVTWAEDRKKRGLTGRDDSPMGLEVQGLRAVDYSGFGVGDASSLASRPANRQRQQAEVQACAPCHARRGPITNVPDVGRTFLDSYRPALLDDGLYYADGQILEEVYEYASFTQSQMYAAGVTCSDCHNAHSLKQRGTGNNVCNHCHLPLTYDTPAHHHHKQGTEAARCAGCHMRTTTYMVVDPRYDHSFRVPRVDYTLTYGIPNACTTPCHADKSVEWSHDAIVKWYGPDRKRGNDYVAALDAGRRGLPGAEKALRAAILTPAFPPIARATALVLLADFYTPASIDALQAGLSDPEAIVRTAAARTLTALEPPDRVRLGRPLLTDAVRLVRAWAASSLAGMPPGLLTQEETAALSRATDEYVALEMAVAERPEAHLNLSSLYLRQGKAREAEAALQTALRIDPRSVPARVNLADLYRAEGREADGERLLVEAVRLEPGAAEALHALGLLYVRQGRRKDAMALLERAYELVPATPRYGYVYAVALHDAGNVDKAVAVLTAVQAARPGDADTLAALAMFERERGNRRAATAWAEKLAALRPDDPGARQILSEIRNMPPSMPRGGPVK
ncbi:MAG: tetratricopeptide repeat protein [Vicinamibacterales bacterium]